MHCTRERLSTYWQLIKKNLHPSLEEIMGPLTNKQEQLITALEVIRLEDFISPYSGIVGRPTDVRVPMARAFIAKAIYGHTTTRQLLDQLKSDIRLRRICGLEKAQDVVIFYEIPLRLMPVKKQKSVLIKSQKRRNQNTSEAVLKKAKNASLSWWTPRD